MPISSQTFGQYEGQEVQVYSMENSQGMVVKITNYGATITSVTVPDTDGGRTDLVCGFDTLDGYFSDAYKANAPYFGSTVGRYSSRIKDGTFSLNGTTYQLAQNNHPHNLHGGNKALDKRIWQAQVADTPEAATLIMRIASADMDESFPGNVEVEVTFSLNNDNELRIEYKAETDKETPLSLTNHSYFNLSGFEHTIHGHKLQVNTHSHLKPDDSNVPTGEIEDLQGKLAGLKDGLTFEEALSELETGFEHYLLFDKPLWKLEKVATFEDPQSGRKLDVATTEPGMLFYSGYFTSDELQRESGAQYGRYRGFCCETHRYPNGPNIAGSPASTTKPGETYRSITIFSFSF